MIENKIIMKALEISTDSRTIKENSIYIPLVGKKFDGHDFIPDCLEKGAAKVFSQITYKDLLEKFTQSSKDKKIIEILESNKEKIEEVENTLKKYQDLARNYKREINPLTIAITGSNGKTTVKEMLASILKTKYRIHYSEANFNNEIGVPKTILAMPEGTEILILEMGMRGLGQIEELSAIAEPNICVITNIGTAHIELLGSQENIRKAKLEIIKYAEDYRKGNFSQDLKKFLLVDTKHFEKLNSDSNFKELIDSINCDSFDNSEKISLNMLSNDGINSSANAAIKVAELLGIDKESSKNILESFSPIKGRGQVYLDSENNIYIDESYNASPETLKLGVEALCKEFPNLNKLIVTAEILENDPELINAACKEIEAIAKNTENRLEFLNLSGKIEEKKDIFLDHLKLKTISGLKEITYRNLLAMFLEKSINKIIYIKASRAAQLEKLILS
ncbi:MAG: UDP-N-acetylmuramoyl-tripeptide--D-alanyl-D-alanine ligase [Candidatus Caenarcaniphilales bacterium]|nr:UDP-N-acetylmuramoyl-tripeptide--D-alanyl-D-alanine ligase [Candidatus Caenarcaniphilales bacterium]